MIGTYKQAATALPSTHALPVTPTSPAAIETETYSKDVIRLLQRAINKLTAYKCWSEEAFLQATRLSLHGEKRRERDYISEKEYSLCKHLQSVAIDVFGEELRPEEEVEHFPHIASFEDYFTAVELKLTEKYYELHDISNQLILLKYEPIARCIKKLYRCFWHMMIEIRRTLREGKLVSWQPHHILIYQIAFHNVHDYIEKITNDPY